MSSNRNSSSVTKKKVASLPSNYTVRAGPQRTTKASGKLKILPEEPEDNAVTAIRPSTLRGTGGGDDEDDNENDENDDSSDEGEDEQEKRKEAKDLRDRLDRAEVNKQLAQIPEGSMRRDARRLTRKGRASLPRVTAYSTAASYRMRELTRFLQARSESHRTSVLTFDECVYTTYSYELFYAARTGHAHHSYTASSSHLDKKQLLSSSTSHPKTGDLLGIPELNEDGTRRTSKNVILSHGDAHGSAELGAASAAGASGAESSNGTLVEPTDADGNSPRKAERERIRREKARQERRERFTVKDTTPEVFFMEYGTVVIWGMTLQEEKRLLRELHHFELERLAPEDVESEELNWYLADYSRIYNDVITLRKGSSYMTKLSLSHALAQSTKISFFEGVIDNTIDTTKDIPQSIAESGKIGMPPAEIMKQIGHLFILRMNIHLVGSIVDSPEIFWSQPDLEPLYSAARSYLEIPQRIDLLNARVEVLQDMLQLLKDQVTHSHSEWLEIIVIILIGLEIVLGVATMIVDLYFA